MVIKKKMAKRSAIKASNLSARRHRVVRAAEDAEDEDIDEIPEDVSDVNVAPEATDLLFEAEDVAQLVAEVTGEEVSVTAEEDVVTFSVGGDEFEVTADGDEELLEASKRVPLKGKSAVKASARPLARGRRIPRK